MDEKLLPCPFCGEAPDFEPFEDDSTSGWVSCSKQGCMMGEIRLEIWQSRTPSPSLVPREVGEYVWTPDGMYRPSDRFKFDGQPRYVTIEDYRAQLGDKP